MVVVVKVVKVCPSAFVFIVVSLNRPTHLSEEKSAVQYQFCLARARIAAIEYPRENFSEVHRKRSFSPSIQLRPLLLQLQ